MALDPGEDGRGDKDDVKLELEEGRGEKHTTQYSFFAWRRRAGPQQDAAAGRWRSTSAPLRGGSSRVSPVRARARGRRPADDGRGRSGAATDERAVDGRMRLGGAEHCRRADDAGTPRVIVVVLTGLRLICRSDWPGGWPGWWIGRLGGWPSGHCKRHAHTVHGP